MKINKYRPRIPFVANEYTARKIIDYSSWLQN